VQLRQTSNFIINFLIFAEMDNTKKFENLVRNESLANEVWQVCLQGYAVSNMGRVFSFKSGKILKPYPNSTDPKKAYLQVMIGATPTLVHKLVLETFVPRPASYYQCNHKNECKMDNRLSNLEWLTASQNVRYGHGLDKRSHKVLVYRKDGFQAYCRSKADAARLTGISADKISVMAWKNLFRTAEDSPKDDWWLGHGWVNIPKPLKGKDGLDYYFIECISAVDKEGNVVWMRPDNGRPIPKYITSDEPHTLSEMGDIIWEDEQEARRLAKEKKCK